MAARQIREDDGRSRVDEERVGVITRRALAVIGITCIMRSIA